MASDVSRATLERVCRFATGGEPLAECASLPAGLNHVFVCRSPDGRTTVVRIPRPDGRGFWRGEQLESKCRSEAAAMEHARELLANFVRVPKVVNVGVEPESRLAFLCIEYAADARTVRHAMRNGEVDGEVIAASVLSMLRFMCSQEPPYCVVGGFHDSPVWFDGPPIGPCPSMQEFIVAMLEWSAEQTAQSHPELSQKLHAYERHVSGLDASHRLVFRHGDLSIDNLLWSDQGLWLIDWEWAGVYDERDVWLEARELLKALNAEHLWNAANLPIPISDLEEFDSCKEIFMGVAWAMLLTGEERDGELEYLSGQLSKMAADKL